MGGGHKWLSIVSNGGLWY